jgi:hypothetical protein
MPPRYVYWTILIDDAPTAFRASERDDLLPTLHQLQRKNNNVVVKWFARGRLWESPEAERAAQAVPRSSERRNQDWRPGGQHKDPRARFDKEAQRRKKREQRAARNQGAPGEGRTEPPRDFNPRASRAPWTPAGQRPRQAGPRPDRGAPGGDRKPWQGPKPPAAGDRRPWQNKPRTDSDRKPWHDKPRTDAERKPWQKKPSGEGERKPWQRDARGAGGRGAQPWRAKQPDAPRQPWQDRPTDPNRKTTPRRENEPKKRDETPDPPPAAEQIVTKPKPPERG